MANATSTTDAYIAFVQEISHNGACFIGPVPPVRDGQIIEVHIRGHYPRKARIVGYFPGGYRLDFTERVYGDTLPQSADSGALTLARTVVFSTPEHDKTGDC